MARKAFGRLSAFRVRSLAIGLLACLTITIATGDGARAQSFFQNGQPVCSGSLARALNSSYISRIRSEWAQLDGEVKACVLKRANASVDQLVDQCVNPGHRRLSRTLSACQSSVKAARLARAEEERSQAAAAAAAAKAEARRNALAEKYGEEIADHIMAKRVVNGMTTEQVQEALGSPTRRDVIPANYELWVYGGKRVALLEGRVSHVEQ